MLFRSREPLHPRSQPSLRHQPHRVRPEYRRRTRRCYRADRVLLRRTQCGRGGRAAVVSRQDDRAGCHRDPYRRGGDELFAGYLTYRANRYRDIARKFPSPLLKAGLAAARFLPVSDDKISFEYKLKRFLQGSLMSPGKAHLFWNGTFSDEEKEQLFRYADPSPLAELLTNLRPGRDLGRFLEFDQRYYLADDILYKVDRISMAHSLEVRPPFLDDRIVDFASHLPDDYKLRGSES